MSSDERQGRSRDKKDQSTNTHVKRSPGNTPVAVKDFIKPKTSGKTVSVRSEISPIPGRSVSREKRSMPMQTEAAVENRSLSCHANGRRHFNGHSTQGKPELFAFGRGGGSNGASRRSLPGSSNAASEETLMEPVRPGLSNSNLQVEEKNLTDAEVAEKLPELIREFRQKIELTEAEELQFEEKLQEIIKLQRSL